MGLATLIRQRISLRLTHQDARARIQPEGGLGGLLKLVFGAAGVPPPSLVVVSVCATAKVTLAIRRKLAIRAPWAAAAARRWEREAQDMACGEGEQGAGPPQLSRGLVMWTHHSVRAA